MPKDSQRKCPDCYASLSIYAVLDKGDGRCAKCDGTGEVADFIDNTCSVCSGTGQCQTCGGTGYEYYYEEVDESYEPNNDESDDFAGDYSSSSKIDYDDDYNSSDLVYSSTDSKHFYNQTKIYCKICGVLNNSDSECLFPFHHDFITGEIYDYCSKCGIIAGNKFSKCHFPFEKHNFVKGNSNEYCIKCGALPLQTVTECFFPYYEHNFRCGVENVFCEKCGKIPSYFEECHFPYNNHNFISGDPKTHTCEICGEVPGKLTKCKFPYSRHKFKKK